MPISAGVPAVCKSKEGKLLVTICAREFCGKLFLANSVGRPRKYCSKYCSSYAASRRFWQSEKGRESKRRYYLEVVKGLRAGRK